ncbi:metallophosphoesterase [bacterium]|nr:metallophosphoesterase [bacterium]
MKQAVDNRRKGKRMIFFFSLLIAGICFAADGIPPEDSLGNTEDPNCCTLWRGDRIHISDPDPGTGCLFRIHEVNKTGNNHLAYTFFFMNDIHIGGIIGKDDYDEPGYAPDTSDGVDVNGPGSYPWNHLIAATNLINTYYDANLGSGVENGEAVFAIIGGDLSNTAEKAELQHAAKGLYRLHLPWIPLPGNHDLWPNA